MSLIYLMVLAVVQGITEFLPISSSAHLILAPGVMGVEDQGPLIDVMAHVGSLLAVLVYFWRDIRDVAAGKPLSLDDVDLADDKATAMYREVIGAAKS